MYALPVVKTNYSKCYVPQVTLIDSGAECVRDISVLLNYFQINSSRHVLKEEHHFYTTASGESFQAIASHWLDEKIDVEHIDL